MEKYNSILSAEIEIMVFFFALLFLLGGVFLIIFIPRIKKSKKSPRHERVDNMVAFILILCLIAGALTAIVIHTVPYVLDIQENAYITYEGNFAVENRDDLRTGHKPLLSFGGEKHQTQFTLKDSLYLEDGFHNGRVIYSQRSRVIVEWHCNICEAGYDDSITSSPLIHTFLTIAQRQIAV